MKILFWRLRRHDRTTNIGATRYTHHSARQVFGLLFAIALSSYATAAANTPTIQQLLDTAHSSPIGDRARYLFDAGNLAIQQNRPDQVEQILKEIGELKLAADNRARAKILLARLQLLQNKNEQALTTLQDRQLQQDTDQLPVAEQSDLSLLRAKAQALTGNYFASAQERVFVDPLLKDQQREENRTEIWRALTTLSANDLQRYRSATTNEQLRGWLELALIAKANPVQQSTQLAQWSRKWGAHSIVEKLPAELTQIRAPTNTEQANQIALLLPQSGKLAAFGEAVRDGFMIAWYDARKQNANTPAVRIYDTDANASILPIYQQAIADGAAIVIGPLEKQQIAGLYKQSLPVPTLALNRFDTNEPAPLNLFQFSLAAEDETAQIANIATQENHRHVLIVAPEEEAHSRELLAYTERWQSRGGAIAATALYSDQQSMSQAIRNALNIPRSEARAKEMENLLNRNLEFTPHRRQDIDMVLMLAKPAQARSIKPLLDFNYAGDLTVYATSRIYNGYPSIGQDRDLEKTRFTEMPFVLQQSVQKQKILAAQPQSKNYLRLYAMGMDSFNLSSRLQNFASGDTGIYGQTGYLTLNEQRVVERESLLAEMRNGAAEAVSTSRQEQNSAKESDLVPKDNTQR